MLTKSDKQFIVEAIKQGVSENNKIIFKEMLDLFSASNERIDQVENRLGNRIDKLEDKVDKMELSLSENTNEVISLGAKIDKILDRQDNHEQRIEKLEDKVFATTINP